MKKGFTTVELITSFVLVSIIVTFLFQIIFSLKDLYVDSGVKLKLVTKQSSINTVINNDIKNRKIISIAKNSDSSIAFSYAVDETHDSIEYKILSFNRTDNFIRYGDVIYELVPGSTIGNVSIKTSIDATASNMDKLNSILSIEIPVYHKLFEKDNFGVSITHLYNCYETGISGVGLSSIVDGDKEIQLIAPSAVAFKNVPWSDPGYYLLDHANSTSSLNDASVEVTGSVDVTREGNYYINYTLYDMNHNILTEVTRTVTVLESEYVYEYTGNEQTFTPLIAGEYSVELWGASGGGNSKMAGLGGYTLARVNLTTTDELKIYVGGAGTIGSNATGGYNGGGSSGTSASGLYPGSGGGATDIRLNSSSYNNVLFVAGGGGGAGTRDDDVATCVGGVGGGSTGGIGVCSADSYLGGAGTQSSGGAKATYSTGVTTQPTNGAKQNGGNGATITIDSTTYGSAGGGGGYYGGGGASRYGGGGGGSGYCSNNSIVVDCDLQDGSELFASPNGIYETGHYGNGYVRIRINSITTAE